jgi:UTP--glucose-1-phosphate uridylyltransferase
VPGRRSRCLPGHRPPPYFNTNSLWLRLDLLKDQLAADSGVLPLPMIRNRKTVDPRDKSSTPVIQLEVAMGAAIECFEGSRPSRSRAAASPR